MVYNDKLFFNGNVYNVVVSKLSARLLNYSIGGHYAVYPRVCLLFQFYSNRQHY